MVLERTLVGVGERARRLYLDLVGVVGARVVEVVDDRRDERGEQLELGEAADEAVAREQQVGGVQHVGAVDRVVVEVHRVLELAVVRFHVEEEAPQRRPTT